MTGRASRLECYDRAFPPIVESVESVEPTASVESAASVASVESVEDEASPPRPRERVATVAGPKPEPARSARIIEVQMPDVSTTVFVAADGRTFVRENARTVIRWPETPFDVELQTGLFGSIYLKLPGRNPRVTVVVRN